MRETLPAYMYRDPCEVLQQKQERELKRSCAGCVHVYLVEIGGSVENGCSIDFWSELNAMRAEQNG